MRRIFAVTCFLACSTLASGQAYTTITATNVTVDNGSGTAVNPPAGSSLCFLGVNSAGAAITYTPSGGSPVSGTVCQTLTSGGALTGTLQVANPATATPLGLYYTITVIDGSTTYLTIPITTVSGTTWSFDTFSLPGTKTALGIGNAHLACASGAQWTSTTLPPGQNAETCNAGGQWKGYPPNNYCPHGQAFMVPQGGGTPFCQSPTYTGNGVPSGICVNGSSYFQNDASSGQNLWSCINGTWVKQIGSGGGPPGGAHYNLQFNNGSGGFGGDSGITTDGNGNLKAKSVGGMEFANGYATGGNGTSGSPWTGWESAITTAPTGSTVVFSPGYFSTSSQITMPQGVLIQCAGYQQTTIESSYAGYTFVAANKAGNFQGGGISGCELQATSATTSWLDADSISKIKLDSDYFTWTTNHTAGTVASNGVAVRFDSTQSAGYYGTVQNSIFEWCGTCISFPAVSNASLGAANETTILNNTFKNYSGVDVNIADRNANGGIDHITLKNNYFAGAVSEQVYDGGNATDIENNSIEPQVGFAGPDIVHSTTSCAGYQNGNKVSGSSTLFSNAATEAGCQSNGSPIDRILDAVNTTTTTPIPIQYYDPLEEWLFLCPENYASPTGGNSVSFVICKGSGNGSILLQNAAAIEEMNQSGGQEVILQLYSDGNLYLQNNNGASGNIYLVEDGSTAMQILSGAINIPNTRDFQVGGNTIIPKLSTLQYTGFVASGTATMTTAAIAAGTCGASVNGTVVNGLAANILGTDTVAWSDGSAQPTSPNGLLRMERWTSNGAVPAFSWCNPTASSQTPAAETINWHITR